MRLLILDNYDSFTYNLYHYARQFCSDVEVIRNDAIDINEVNRFTHIIISPGPGLPQQAGISLEILNRYAQTKSILGVCLGFQALGIWAGAKLYNKQKVSHGISRLASRKGESWLLNQVPSTFKVGLYHSWAVQLAENTSLQPTAFLQDNTLMAFEHPHLPLAGIQFHLESIMTEGGLQMMENWIYKKPTNALVR